MAATFKELGIATDTVTMLKKVALEMQPEAFELEKQL